MAYERLLGKSPEGRKHRVRTRSAAAFWCLRGTLLGDPASDAEGREARSGCHGLTAGEPEARQGRGEQHAEATFLDRESCREVSRIIRGEFSQTKQGVEGEGGQRVGGGDKDTGIPHQPLYTIVCGSESGLDMDCVDSVQRDAMYCGMGPHLGLHERLLDNVQVRRPARVTMHPPGNSARGCRLWPHRRLFLHASLSCQAPRASAV